jgi:hypothetical protein
MRKLFLLLVCFFLLARWSSAEQFSSTSEATVFLRVIGKVRVEHESSWKDILEEKDVELATGSGFIISPLGYVLTNYHLISGEEVTVFVRGEEFLVTIEVESIEVSSSTEAQGVTPTQRFAANIEAVDPELDLAVLSIGGTDLPYIPFGDSDAVVPGQKIQVLGYPLGAQVEVGAASFEEIVPQVSVSGGSLSAVRRDEGGRPRYIQTDASLNPGNSGGPMVDQDGYALGIIVMKMRRASNIGFAIPINRAKDFFEVHGLEWLFRAPRMRLGPYQYLEAKALGLRLPQDSEDLSPGRLLVDAQTSSGELELRIDRVASPWTLDQLEKALLSDGFFDQFSSTSIAVRRPSARARPTSILGHASGNSTADRHALKMDYAIVDLGREKLVARYLAPAEQLAFNLGAIRNSLDSLRAERLLTDELNQPVEATWAEVPLPSPTAPYVIFPEGWVYDLTGPFACPGLPLFDTALAANPPGDFTVSFRLAWWQNAGVDADKAALACSPSQEPSGDASYASRHDWLGMEYANAGAFVPVGEGLIQLEVVTPVEKLTFVQNLFKDWVEVTRAKTKSPDIEPTSNEELKNFVTVN